MDPITEPFDIEFVGFTSINLLGNSLIKFDDTGDTKWSADASDFIGKVNIEAVALHELGHALGLPHKCSKCAQCDDGPVMAAGFYMDVDPCIDLQADDINRIRDLYEVGDACEPPETTVTVTIPSTQPWTDTGLTVTKCDEISITASGTVIFADPHTSENTAGPDGSAYTPGGCTYVVTDAAVPAHSLIGNIADSWSLDGKGFFVGSSFQGTVPIPNTTKESGKLFMGFNDGAVYCDRSGYDSWGFGGDNHGSFTATITITSVDDDACDDGTGDITWATKADMPTGRSFLGTGVVNNKIYAIGGGTGTSNVITGVTSVEEYNPLTDSWVTKTPMPTARYGLATGVVNNKIYAIGGAPDNIGAGVLATVEEYDPLTDSWVVKAPMPTARLHLAVGVVNNKIYAIGGENKINALATIEEYDPSTDSWHTSDPSIPGTANDGDPIYDPVNHPLTPMPTFRHGLTISVVNNKIYAIGGSSGSYSAVVEEYDPSTNSWTTMESMPTPRVYLASGAVNNGIYVVGGMDSGNRFPTVEVYNPLTDSWHTSDPSIPGTANDGDPIYDPINHPLTPMPTGRNGLAIGMVNKRIYAIGGEPSMYQYSTPLVEEGTID